MISIISQNANLTRLRDVHLYTYMPFFTYHHNYRENWVLRSGAKEAARTGGHVAFYARYVT